MPAYLPPAASGMIGPGKAAPLPSTDTLWNPPLAYLTVSPWWILSLWGKNELSGVPGGADVRALMGSPAYALYCLADADAGSATTSPTAVAAARPRLIAPPRVIMRTTLSEAGH